MRAVLRGMLALLLAANAGLAGAGDAALAATRCAACHGIEGSALVTGVPHLAAQKRGYLLAQLRAYRDGRRRDPAMQAAVSGLDADALDRLAGYFAGLPAPSTRAPAADAPGRNAAAICTPCHGALGVSGNDAWPDLAGQRADYLQAQLQAYASGTRPDRIMSRTARSLDAASIAAISHYFESLRSPLAGRSP